MVRRFQLLVVGLALGVLAHPAAAAAQPAVGVPRIGILSAGPLPPRAHQWEAFRRGLRELGYVEGKTIMLELRAPREEGGRHDELAADLVRLKVDVIVAATAPAIQAARRATGTIPIVMATSADAVRDGLVASLSRPGGNVTGLSMLQTDLSGKRVELLREIAPGVSRLAVLLNPASAQSVSQLREVEAAARALGVVTVRLEVSRADQLERALRAAAEGGADSLIVLTEPLFYGLRARVAELALKHRLPATAPWTVFAEAGGLVSYGASDTENYRRAATYVDKILKGAKPADLPVEQPTVFDLSVNLKTARALGLTIPPSVLARADRVIE